MFDKDKVLLLLLLRMFNGRSVCQRPFAFCRFVEECIAGTVSALGWETCLKEGNVWSASEEDSAKGK